MIGPMIVFTQWSSNDEPVAIDLLSIRAVYFRGQNKVEIIRSDAGSTYVIGTVLGITNEINKGRKQLITNIGTNSPIVEGDK